MAEKKTREIQKKQETQLQEGVEPAREGRLFVPATDICEHNDSIVLTADMPGVKPEGVKVTLESNVLTVTGTIADEHRRSANAAYAEYEVGNYQRSFAVSDEINRDKIEAIAHDPRPADFEPRPGRVIRWSRPRQRSLGRA